MDCLLQICIEGIGGLESKKGKNLIDILSGDVEQPSYFIRTSGTLGRNVIRFSTAIKRKRHQIIWQQNFYRRASGLRVEWDDQFIKDKTQIPVSKHRCGVVSDEKSKLIFELVRIDKFESDCVIAIADINPIHINILNAGTGSIDSIRKLFERVYPFQLQGSLVGDVGNHDLSLRASVCCLPTVIPLIYSLPQTEDIAISFSIVIKQAKNVPIKILKAATSFYCSIGGERSNAVLSSSESLDPLWNETVSVTFQMNPSISKTSLSKPFLDIELRDHRGNGVPELLIGKGVLHLWDFFSGISKDNDIHVPLLRNEIEGTPSPSDSRGHIVLHITEPSLTHKSANLLHNAYHEMAVQKIDTLYEQSRSQHTLLPSSAKSGKLVERVTNHLQYLSNGSRYLKCLIICCMEDCDDEKVQLESDVIVKVQALAASLDVGLEICSIYFDPDAHSDPYLLRLLVKRIFECEICVFVLGLVPGALVDRSNISDVFDCDFDDDVDAWLRSHFSEFEEQEESLIEVLSHAVESKFREDSNVTEKVLMFQRQLVISENKLPDGSDYTIAHESTTEMARSKVYNAAAVDRISRRIASFGASCFNHNDAVSFVAIAHEQFVASIKISRLNGFRSHSLLNSSIFELQYMRSMDSNPSKCHSFTQTHAFRTIILSLESCSSGNTAAPLFITSEDSLTSKYLYCALCNHMRSMNFRNLGSDFATCSRRTPAAFFQPCFLYDFSASAGSKAPVSFLRALLQGLRAILASEPFTLIDDITFESGLTSNELTVLVKPLIKAAIEEYTSFSLLLSGIESLDPAVLEVVLGIAPASSISGLWICLLFGSQDIAFSCKIQSVVFSKLPCACMCACIRPTADTDSAIVLIQECRIKHSSLGVVLQKFRCHPNLCSLASFLSAVSHAFLNCSGADTTQMFIQLAQSTAASSTFTDILCDVLSSMHSVDNGSLVFQFLMLCSRSRYGLQPSDLISISNMPSSLHVVCIEILRAFGGCAGSFCTIPFNELYTAIERVLALSADPRSAIRICDATILKYFSATPVTWKVLENIIHASEVTGDFSVICKRLLECNVQHYIVSNEFCLQDFRSLWMLFCKHPAAESISHRTKLLHHLSEIRALTKESCNFIVVATKFCSSISLYETSDAILKSFKGLYQNDIAESSAKMTSTDWSRLCLIFALQGRLSLAWGRLDVAESVLKEALAAHGSAVDSDKVASDTSSMFDASRAVCARLLSEIASILLVRNRAREALSFADKSVAFIDGIDSLKRGGFMSPSCVLDIMTCAMEARLANNLKTGAFKIIDSALRVCDSEFGKFHPRSMLVYERLCSLNCIADNVSDALVMYDRILKDLTIQLEWGFDVTGKLTTIILLISDILVSNHEMSEAVAMCEKALKYRAERYGQEPNLQVARCLEKLGACRIHAKDPKHAAQNLRDALKIRQVLSNSKKDQDYYMCVLQLSGALKAAGYRSEARQHLKEWIEHLKAELGDDHEFVHTALDIVHSRMND